MMTTRQVISATLALLLAAQSGALADEDPHAKHRAMMQQKSETPVSEFRDIDLRDRTLLNQDGEEVKFASEVIGDNIVVMDFVYTTCTTICPVLSALFTQVQGKLGDRLGDGVVMVSMTVDPVRDTPQRLKAYSAKHHASEGWVWLTGPKSTVEDVLTGVGAYTTNFEDHPSMVLVGDGRTGEWKRLFGFPNPDRIMQVVNELQESRRTGG
jgi:protein SCO1/2